MVLILIFITLVAAASVATATALALHARRARRSWLARTTAERVIVHTTEDQSFEGLMVEGGPAGVVLDAVRLLQDGGNVDMAGTVWVPGSKVHLIQKAPG